MNSKLLVSGIALFLATTSFAAGTTGGSNTGVYQDNAMDQKSMDGTAGRVRDGVGANTGMNTSSTTGVYDESVGKYGDTDAGGRYIPGSNARNRNSRTTVRGSTNITTSSSTNTSTTY